MKKNSVVIFILVLSVFAAITNEMGIVGVLPQITEKFHITTSQAGILVSIFALVVALCGPFVTLIFSGLNRKALLLFIMFILTIANTVNAYSQSFGLTLLFRIIPALFLALLISLAISVAIKLAPVGQQGKASAKVFAGVTLGLVLGVPVTSLLADQFSLQAAFLFSASVSAVSFIGIAFLMPTMPVEEKLSYGKQFSILGRLPVWLNLLTVTFIFATMFSVYSYFAEYVTQISHVKGAWISILLMLFGLFGLVGNFLFSNLLHKNLVRTVMLYPIIYLVVYGIINFAGMYTIPMIILVFFWGTVHSGGLIISQTWLSTETADAPEFGNSLYMSFSNLGITIGSALAGWFISQLGTGSLLLSGMLFALLAALTIVLKLSLFRKNSVESYSK
ncbi:MFS transporter [Priestia megaterium]|uniref:MFS transporter n=1 Tax=Priestia megaterium TaxID=1404 RepID=UPI000BF95EB7|nr:MFS transporter [Priestia megaterium]RFB20943.1 MFS transporter [Bacillus sp. ALD]MCR8866008.1 MFS transporter [Priestia megaterium]MDR7207434.1 putative MFS family arabinose efflux permease [Priestia megaterium]PFK60640.1 MFS transporter [Priestia megaterium]PFP45493.1 MFS transporter [Priestia megaterium]